MVQNIEFLSSKVSLVQGTRGYQRTDIMAETKGSSPLAAVMLDPFVLPSDLLCCVKIEHHGVCLWKLVSANEIFVLVEIEAA